MKIPAVVVFYNPSEENIKNIKVYEKSVAKIYVVDNSDDEVIRLKNTKKIEYIKLYTNKGIASALNEGAKKAMEDGYDWLLTLDQDSQITSDVIEKLKKYLLEHDTSKIGLVSPYQDINAKEELKDVEAEEMLEVMTSGNIINLKAWQEIGGFKDWLFIDCVDTEYCMNLNEHGFKVLRLNKVWMTHHLGNLVEHKFLGKIYPCYNHSPIRRYYIMRNNLYINEMYKDKYPLYCKHLLRIQKGQVKRILLFEPDKYRKLKMMYKGYRDFKKKIKGKYEE